MGKLIAIEGSDGSGKETQSKILYENLKNNGYNVEWVSYPNYKSNSSALVKMYLSGEYFGRNPNLVNPYVASSFYAVDRFASFISEWAEFYNENPNNIVVCDRYVISNMIHQASKIKDLKEKDKFLDWEYNYEFIKGGLPIPDCVFFLNVPPSISLELMSERSNKIDSSSRKDIHESNKEFLVASYENSLYLVKKYDWVDVNCIHNNSLLDCKSIGDDIYQYLLENKII